MTAWVAVIAAAAAIAGTPGDDRLTGTQRADRIYGKQGDDDLRGRHGRDRLVGGRGFDRLDGGPGDDVINARRGDQDEVFCGTGNDVAIVDDMEEGVFDCEDVRFPATSPPS